MRCAIYVPVFPRAHPPAASTQSLVTDVLDQAGDVLLQAMKTGGPPTFSRCYARLSSSTLRTSETGESNIVGEALDRPAPADEPFPS
jgi:hypothetical protein